jgi:hypothetical protein
MYSLYYSKITNNGLKQKYKIKFLEYFVEKKYNNFIFLQIKLFIEQGKAEQFGATIRNKSKR